MKIIFCLFILVGATRVFAKDQFKNPEANFKEVLQTLKQKYVDRGITDEELYEGAVAGMLSSLNKGEVKWNTLLTPREMQDFQIQISGNLVGIGATLDWDANTGRAKVLFVLPDSAALKYGLLEGDEILSVNGERFKGKTLADMVYKIRGKADESVRLKILREDRIMDVKVVRQSVKMDLFQKYLLEPRVGLIKIESFTEKASKEVQKQLAFFEGKDLKKLIVDLRSNTGGLFTEAISVAKIFSNKGQVVARTKDRAGKVEDYRAEEKAWRPEVKIVVLVDGDTSSGAELLAASLKENRQAFLIGGKTNGKWNAQAVETLPNGYSIKYSVMNFESPSGKSYQDIGIKPDLEATPPKENHLPAFKALQKDVKAGVEADPSLKAAVEIR